ncbi:MAG TPA: NAD-dependent epimerase/dehydratase family protein [Acidimicrobiales bacterium]|nr:NAD-dependent epimerase/dehydratase family protein [Acidimicrobiales bacterium]
MKVFVTGGTGVVGTRAVPALVAAGHEVTAVARTPEKAELVRSMGATPVTVDLFDPAAVKAAVDGHDAVAHLATNIPPLTKAARTKAWETNERLRTEVSRHLVDAALATGATRYVQESICFPYVDHGADWITEESPLEHSGVFEGAAHAEAATARFTAAGGSGVVLRFAQFHGPGSHHVEVFNGLARRRINPFVGAPDAYTSFIHADDAGSAVAAALALPAGIYNVGDDEPLTRAEAGLVVAEALGVKPPHALPGVARAASPRSAKALMRSLRISNAKLKGASGWRPAHPSIRGSWAT